MGRLCEYMELYLNIPKASSKIFKTIFLHFIKCRQSKLRFLEHLRAIVRMMRRRSSSSKKVIWASPGNHLRGIWVSFSYSPLDNWFRRKWKKVSFFSRYCSKKWCVKMWLILFFGLLVFKISIRKKCVFCWYFPFFKSKICVKIVDLKFGPLIWKKKHFFN